MLICNNQLNNAQLHALDNLSALCRAADGGLPPFYQHILAQKRTMDNNILYFHKDNLVGFLSIFFFYANACEVCVIVDPAYRKQGIAKQLIKTMLPLPLSKQIDTLLFSAPTLASAKWLTQFGFVYNNSEYHMERNSFEPIFVTKHALTFRKATEADIPTLYSIDNLCFSTDEDNMSGRFDNIIDDSNYTVFLAFHNGKAVGKAHLRWQTDDVILSDIAIIPSFQKQGLGSELLAYCINHALSAGKTKLALDVETSNQNALKLYTRNGFKTSNATDFWAIKTDKLRTVFEPR